jgi:hypothetical protein
MKSPFAFIAVSLLATTLAVSASAQGMPPEARDNIHRLFDQHAAVKRTVTLTATGYTALTESDDPLVAKTLREHVDQMRARLDAGMGVRRWDPAYDEIVRHYKDLELKVEPTEKGLRVVMTGKTPAAVKIAQNHAQIVSKFVAHGWSEHDVEHPAVAATAAQPAPAAGTCGQGCGNCGGGGKESGESGKRGGACCRADAKPAGK